MADAQTRYEVVVTDTGAQTVRRNIEDIGTGAEKASRGVDLLSSTLKLLGGYLGVRQLIEYADGYQQITNMLKYATKTLQEYSAVEQALFNVSQRTYSSFDANTKLFQRMVVATSNLGTSYKDLLSFITTVDEAFALSKLSTQEATNSLIQLAQGMAKGVLNGDELRTVLESAPILADALARGLNTTTGALRKMGETGELTTKRVMDALQKQAPRIHAEFAKMVPTIGQGWQVLTNAVERFVGQSSQATGAGAAISKTLMFLGNNIVAVTNAVSLAIGVWLAYRAALLITALVQAVATGITAMNAAIVGSVAVIGAASTAFAVLRGVMVGLAVATGLNPFTIMVVTLTALIGIVYLFGNAIKVNFAGTISLTSLLTIAWTGLKNIVAGASTIFFAVVGAIQQSETAMNLLKSTLVLLIAAFLALTLTTIIGWFVTATGAVLTLAGSFAALMFWPTVVIGGLLSIGYIIAYMTGNVENWKNKIVSGFEQVRVEAEKLTAKAAALSNSNNETAGSFEKLLQKSFGAASALGTFGKAANGAHGEAKNLHGTIQGINTDADYWVRHWDGLMRKFHDWQMETRNFTTTFQEWQRHLQATAALDNYVSKMQEAGLLTKDFAKHVSESGDAIDYQVGALGRLDEALARAAGSYSYLAKEASGASTATDSVAKATVTSQTARNTASDPKTYTFATWSTSKVMEGVGNAFERAAELSAKSGVPVPEGYDQVKRMFRDYIDYFAQNGGNGLGGGRPNNKAEIINILSKLSDEAKTFLRNTTVGGWINGFKSGGSFTVGGQGGPDSQLVQFMASPNERVSVETPSQQHRRDRDDEPTGTRPVVVNMTVNTRDADSFRRSETQTLTSLQSRIRRATR